MKSVIRDVLKKWKQFKRSAVCCVNMGTFPQPFFSTAYQIQDFRHIFVLKSKIINRGESFTVCGYSQRERKRERGKSLSIKYCGVDQLTADNNNNNCTTDLPLLAHGRSSHSWISLIIKSRLSVFLL